MDININDIKNGMTIIIDGNLCSIVEFQHVKPGKGPAFVLINKGTFTIYPVSILASLFAFVAVFPLTAGSVSITSNSIFSGME